VKKQSLINFIKKTSKSLESYSDLNNVPIEALMFLIAEDLGIESKSLDEYLKEKRKNSRGRLPEWMKLILEVKQPPSSINKTGLLDPQDTKEND